MSFISSDNSYNHPSTHQDSDSTAKAINFTDHRKRFVCWVYVFCAILILSFCACGKDDLEKIKNKANEAIGAAKKTATDVGKKTTDTIKKATDTVQETIGAGSVKLDLENGPVNCNACFANFIDQSPQRQNVLKLQSHLDMQVPKFPAALIHVQTDSPLAQLVGQTASASIFFQTSESGPIWTSDDSEPVQVKITSMEDQIVKVDLVGGKLQSSDGKSIDASGSIEGVLQ